VGRTDTWIELSFPRFSFRPRPLKESTMPRRATKGHPFDPPPTVALPSIWADLFPSLPPPFDANPDQLHEAAMSELVDWGNRLKAANKRLADVVPKQQLATASELLSVADSSWMYF
jgi:hypothetical protein